MTCFSPVVGYRSKQGRSPSGGWPIVFKLNEGYKDKEVVIPCGRCIGCRLDKTATWAMRIMCESQLHKENSYLTLTYEEGKINEKKELDKEELQKFWKRLRFRLSEESGERGESRTIRYFCAGEYGDSYGRPHYHAALFGYDFSGDRVPWKKGVKDILYRSPMLEKEWGNGICTVQELNLKSALYIAKYVCKRLSKEKEGLYNGKSKEFALMSRRPGIARSWYEKYYSDVSSVDSVVLPGGRQMRPGRFFDSIREGIDKVGLETAKRERREKISPEESYYKRLEKKERLKLHQQKWSLRSYEKQNLFNP